MKMQEFISEARDIIPGLTQMNAKATQSADTVLEIIRDMRMCSSQKSRDALSVALYDTLGSFEQSYAKVNDAVRRLTRLNDCYRCRIGPRDPHGKKEDPRQMTLELGEEAKQ